MAEAGRVADSVSDRPSMNCQGSTQWSGRKSWRPTVLDGSPWKQIGRRGAVRGMGGRPRRKCGRQGLVGGQAGL